MAFPEFDSTKKGVLFFSRGRGCGHAIPDIEIVKGLLKESDDVEVRFVSYATGARTIEEFGFPLVDLDLPELNPETETTVLAGKLIRWLRPDLVVSHEEFAALPVAKIFDRSTIFITDWFTDAEKHSMHTLKCADEILFMDEPGHFDEPPWVKGRVKYVGPVLRNFEYTHEDRPRARHELGIPPDATVISVFPGSWTEEEVPIMDMVLGAYDRLTNKTKRLVWVAGSGIDLLRNRVSGRQDVILRGRDWQIDRIMVASDVAITKATRVTSIELASFGIPSVALCPGVNRGDEARIRRIDQVIPLDVRQVTAEKLFAALIAQEKRPPGGKRRFQNSAASEIAGRIRARLADGCRQRQ